MLKFLQHTAVATAFILSLNATAQTPEPLCSIGYSGIGGGSSLRTGSSGGPYILTAKETYERKLADGNEISGFAINHQMRDTQGRTRTENPTSCRIVDGSPQLQAALSVFDPRGRHAINWVSGRSNAQKVAMVFSLPPASPRPCDSASQVRRVALQQNATPPSTTVRKASSDTDEMKTEDLGRRNMAGLEAVGTRMTRTVLAGKQGNAQPLITTTERWTSVQYGIIVFSVNDDPVYGKATYEVTDFQPIEPNASAFQPPADYKVEEYHSPQSQ